MELKRPESYRLTLTAPCESCAGRRGPKGGLYSDDCEDCEGTGRQSIYPALPDLAALLAPHIGPPLHHPLAFQAWQAVGRMAALEAENARLRAVLDRIVGMGDNSPDCADVARRALETAHE